MYNYISKKTQNLFVQKNENNSLLLHKNVKKSQIKLVIYNYFAYVYYVLFFLFRKC